MNWGLNCMKRLNIYIDESIAPIVTFDTPKGIKNENSLKEIDRRIRKSGYKKNELFN